MAKKGIYTPFNRNIDSLLLANPILHANKQWLYTQIFTYLAELDSGASPKELGFSKRRKKQRPTSLIFSKNGNVQSGLFDAKHDPEEFKLAHLKLKGVMRLEDGMSTRGVNSLIRDVRDANNSDQFAGIFLEVNSGGGESIAGQEVRNAILDSVLPVYTFGQLVASAALNGTLPSTKIFLSGKGSEMGSIGSMLTIDKGFLKFYRKNFQDIYSKTSPDKNIEFRQLLETGKIDLLVDYVTENDRFFMDAVQEFRNLPEATRESTLKGAMFSAEEAVERGLADGILTFDQTLQAIAADLSSGNSSNINSPINFNTKMEIKVLSKTWSAIISNFNRATGTKIAEDAKPEDVLTTTSTVPSLQDFKNSVIADATSAINERMKELVSKVNSLETVIKNLNSEITKLKEASNSQTNNSSGLQEQLNTLTSEIETLKTTNTELKSTNTDLVNQIAEITGQPVTDSNGNPVIRENTGTVGNEKVKITSRKS